MFLQHQSFQRIKIACFKILQTQWLKSHLIIFSHDESILRGFSLNSRRDHKAAKQLAWDALEFIFRSTTNSACSISLDYTKRHVVQEHVIIILNNVTEIILCGEIAGWLDFRNYGTSLFSVFICNYGMCECASPSTLCAYFVLSNCICRYVNRNL